MKSQIVGTANATEKSSAKKHPAADNNTASQPFPSSKSLCPGSIDKIVSASGAPRNMEGMHSRKLCDTPIETMIIAIEIGWKYCSKAGEIATIIADIVFECMPGSKAAIKPNITPANVHMMISPSIKLLRIFSF